MAEKCRGLYLSTPYTKSADLAVDPQAPGEPSVPTGFPANTPKFYAPEYGINPYLAQTPVFPYVEAYTPLAPRALTSISRPADIVAFTQKYSDTELNPSVVPTGDEFYGYEWLTGLYFITVSTDPPDCSSTVGSAPNHNICTSGWNAGGYYQSALSGVQAAGAWTGGGSMRGNQLMVVSFVDGHAASKAPGALAQGTNYNGAMGSNNVPTQNASAIQMLDMTSEHYYGIQ